MRVQSFTTLATTAALITSASASVTMDYVTVGNAGNAADPLTGYGAVAYEYQIGKYEVTNAQYAQFLNAKAATDTHGLYNSSMSGYGITRSGSSGSYAYSLTGGLESHPVVYISWFDAARFANWLSNGQGSGDTETGSYTILGGATSGVVTVNTGAKTWIPSEDEWYKAAYFNPVSQTYSLYQNGQNTIITADANYSPSSGSTEVGSYSGASSMYGTFDQAGNVWEWNDAIIYASSYSSDRGIRGGAWNSDDASMASSYRFSVDPSVESVEFGFRLASAVPEPSSLILTILASGVVLLRRKR